MEASIPTLKKRIERALLEQFVRALREIPAGEVEATEEPDFLVHLPNRTLGLEVSELHRPTPDGEVPSQAAEAMRRRVVARAQDIYVARGLPAVHASVHLDSRKSISKGEVESLATSIATLVARNVPVADDQTVYEDYNWENRSYFPENVSRVSVGRFSGVTKTFFGCPGATFVPQLTREDIVRVLARKETKRTRYQSRCSELWLVVVADLAAMSTWFEFDSTVLDVEYSTGFDRVFLFRQFPQLAHELRRRA
ncbi:MAG: hypothetical protein FJY56_01030 [Betaproteobacteria bacterium]|nr:hypothetical protein [Betaproteobacteria bacterium]